MEEGTRLGEESEGERLEIESEVVRVSKSGRVGLNGK